MFTGIVREVGRVVSFDGRRLVVEADETRAAEGDSVAVDGVCLTSVDGSQLAFDVVEETLSRTTLGAGEPLGGHLVQGHVDGLGRVRSVGEPVWIDAPAELARYLVEKGSITVDGVSLTVAAVDERGFAVALVPHTLEATTLGELAAGDPINLEVDILAKYVERLLPATLW